MAPFAFRLEKVLRYRAHMEKKVRLQLSETMTRVKEQEKAIAHLGESRMDAAKALAEERAGGIKVFQDRLAVSFLENLADQAEDERKELGKSMERLDLLRKLLTIAATKKKSLERLKDVHVERYREECGKAEQRVLDDLLITAGKAGS